MTSKARIRLAAMAIVALAFILPVAAYGRDAIGPRSERQVDALVALTTGFTFQGRLTDGGSPANGAYDLNFYLYDALAGGSQVGPVQTLGDVAVTAGLFTVTLDFGDVFHGSQYFLEIQVRPGASAGSYTVLSPRETIHAVPNASFAQEAASANALQGVDVSINAPAVGEVLKFDGVRWSPAPAGGGGFSLPYAATQSFLGPLIKVTNSSTGAGASAIVAESSSTAFGAAALVGRITSTTPGGTSAGVRGINEGTGGLGVGVHGSQEGTGWGVLGEAPGGRGVYGFSGTGSGVYGFSTSGNGGYFGSSTGDALEVSGRIKVSGSRPAAFEHVVVAPLSGGDSLLDYPALNGNPTALVFITQTFGVANPHPVGVYYDGARWRIHNANGVPVVLGSRYHVLVINQ